jgi:hypothetical protein
MAKQKENNPEESTNITTKISPLQLLNDGMELGSFVCNWDPAEPELSRLLFLAEVPNSVKGDDLVGTEIDVAYWICTRIEIPDRQDNTMVPVVRSVLIGPNDEIVSTLSHGIIKSIDLMRRTFGDKPYNPPIRMVVKGVSTGTGSDMLMLVPVSLERKA